jgi:arginine utilization regulatory protein
LRVLQDHKVRRVGGLSEKKVDLRIISATNVNPLAAVAAKSLRADLYYRLGVVQVRIPPLRERREDIPYLARYFVDKLKHKLGKEVAGISEGLTQSLKQRAWQGNVRELEHVIESAMNFVSHGDILGERHVKRASRNVEQFGSVPNLTGGQLPWTDQKEAARLAGKHEAGLARVFKDGDVARPQGPRKAMVRFKWEQESEDRDSLVEALTLNRGIVSRAAAYLGMSQQLASYRMKKYKLKREDYVHK